MVQFAPERVKFIGSNTEWAPRVLANMPSRSRTLFSLFNARTFSPFLRQQPQPPVSPVDSAPRHLSPPTVNTFSFLHSPAQIHRASHPDPRSIQHVRIRRVRQAFYALNHPRKSLLRATAACRARGLRLRGRRRTHARHVTHFYVLQGA
jgi:hypothetical protein